jgi:hypothetical protein
MHHARAVDLDRQRRGQGQGDFLQNQESVVYRYRETFCRHPFEDQAQGLGGDEITRDGGDVVVGDKLDPACDMTRLNSGCDSACPRKPVTDGESKIRSQTVRLSPPRSISPAR